ncbi:MAG TPA: ATP-binding protein [Solirubrobacteraceae bacterium]|jgi:anti-sigma regulatory factor (Ser/Thr protein kinase)
MRSQKNVPSRLIADDGVWLAEEHPNLHARLATRLDAPARARALVSDWCRAFELDGSRGDMLRLLVTEIVTNAVVHPWAPREPVIVLGASFSGENVIVTVTDTGTGPSPAPRTPQPTSGGYGLFLLERSAIRWGVDEVRGTRVWFEI